MAIDDALVNQILTLTARAGQRQGDYLRALADVEAERRRQGAQSWAEALTAAARPIARELDPQTQLERLTQEEQRREFTIKREIEDALRRASQPVLPSQPIQSAAPVSLPQDPREPAQLPARPLPPSEPAAIRRLAEPGGMFDPSLLVKQRQEFDLAIDILEREGKLDSARRLAQMKRDWIQTETKNLVSMLDVSEKIARTQANAFRGTTDPDDYARRYYTLARTNPMLTANLPPPQMVDANNLQATVDGIVAQGTSTAEFVQLVNARMSRLREAREWLPTVVQLLRSVKALPEEDRPEAWENIRQFAQALGGPDAPLEMLPAQYSPESLKQLDQLDREINSGRLYPVQEGGRVVWRTAAEAVGRQAAEIPRERGPSATDVSIAEARELALQLSRLPSPDRNRMLYDLTPSLRQRVLVELGRLGIQVGEPPDRVEDDFERRVKPIIDRLNDLLGVVQDPAAMQPHEQRELEAFRRAFATQEQERRRRLGLPPATPAEIEARLKERVPLLPSPPARPSAQAAPPAQTGPGWTERARAAAGTAAQAITQAAGAVGRMLEGQRQQFQQRRPVTRRLFEDPRQTRAAEALRDDPPYTVVRLSDGSLWIKESTGAVREITDPDEQREILGRAPSGQ